MNITILKGEVVEISEMARDKYGRLYLRGYMWTNNISWDNREENARVDFYVWDHPHINLVKFKENFLNQKAYLIGYEKHVHNGNLLIIEKAILLSELENKNETEEISNLLWKVFG
ncbi:hypothetical protein [Spiroplasma eriocheiris]|uniref:Uncharacterized protein n=1 Tax=Spiroplasma eriocheiris TaxID=315358 RepID=A0A0H3XN04_9MOLU|nr:hypothetical protein [Spiroplasma eriocheiris]AHF58051.1 hypothetical protein SPE_0931 [Spiroplasma eriocheiris CCTCC M 207170]AKM54492.1 hypothetical protein SERIO_v1c09320 [Spiroplasma eriocheiris]